VWPLTVWRVVLPDGSQHVAVARDAAAARRIVVDQYLGLRDWRLRGELDVQAELVALSTTPDPAGCSVCAANAARTEPASPVPAAPSPVSSGRGADRWQG
jgi:hypothetical protein